MKTTKILWIDLQPSLYCLFKRTTQSLGQHFKVNRWSFEHDLDESCDVDIVHNLLRQTIDNSPTPVHLIGHGISGTIAYLYAQKYPNNVSSVSVLSVDTHSMNQWTSHYQRMRCQLLCSRFHILNHLSSLLVERNSEDIGNIVTKLLARCLDNDFVYGSIIKSQRIENINTANAPILVINGEKDFIVDEQSHDRWKQYLKAGDCYHKISNGRHFFPFTEWSQTSSIIETFIKMVPEHSQSFIPNHYKNLSINKTNS